MKLGIDRLLTEPALRRPLQGKKVAVLGHPASMTSRFEHTLDALSFLSDIRLSAALGPQHGMRGDKQDNMIESDTYVDPVHKIPVFSLYGEVRRPTAEMLDTFDVLLVDLQDIGCRIYTFATTLLYVLEAGAKTGKSVWVLDRPNPAGRPIEGTILRRGQESFVGAGPLIMRHGLTFAELAQWFVAEMKLDVDLLCIEMTDYAPNQRPGYGWPHGDLDWVNPSPNAASLNMARCFSGTVLLEGTQLSEGRGTTVPLEIMGAPDIDHRKVLAHMQKLAPEWLRGCHLRLCYFEPTFHKHVGKLCSGLQIHTVNREYQPEEFKPYRLVSLFIKSIRELYPDYPIWRNHEYEYERGRLPIDVITGGSELRTWVDTPGARPQDFDAILRQDETLWREQYSKYFLYE